MRVTRAAAGPAPAPPRADQPRRLAERGVARGSSGPPAPIRGRPSRHRRAAAGRSRCRAPPGSPTACRARRPRSAAGYGRCRRARRPGTKVVRSAATSLELQAGDEAGEVDRHGCRCRRCSRRRRSASGSVRQPACFCPVSSSRVVSQSCGYSTCTTRSVPSSPAATICARLPHHRIAGVVVGEHEHARRGSRPAAPAACASSSVVVSGLSQMTWMPASRKALAAGAVQVVGRDDRRPRRCRRRAGRFSACAISPKLGVAALRVEPELGARRARRAPGSTRSAPATSS